MEDLVAQEFFQFNPELVYREVYGICYNEFLGAVTCLRDALLQEFPERCEEVEKGCRALLEDYSGRMDDEWFPKFLQYCSKNIFCVPRHVPVYGTDAGNEERDRKRAEKLRANIMAVQYLNARLRARLTELDSELERRRLLLREIEEAEKRHALLQKAKELEGQLREVAGELWQEEEEEEEQ